MADGIEAPWFSEPPEAALYWSTPELGHLHFVDPQGNRAVVPVTRGKDYKDERLSMNVWHIDVAEGSDVATVSPSVHYVGFWHSPNPVVFKLVKSLDG